MMGIRAIFQSSRELTQKHMGLSNVGMGEGEDISVGDLEEAVWEERRELREEKYEWRNIKAKRD